MRHHSRQLTLLGTVVALCVGGIGSALADPAVSATSGPSGGTTCGAIADGAGYLVDRPVPQSESTYTQPTYTQPTYTQPTYGDFMPQTFSRTWSVWIVATTSTPAGSCQAALTAGRTYSGDATRNGTRAEPGGVTCTFAADDYGDHHSSPVTTGDDKCLLAVHVPGYRQLVHVSTRGGEFDWTGPDHRGDGQPDRAV